MSGQSFPLSRNSPYVWLVQAYLINRATGDKETFRWSSGAGYMSKNTDYPANVTFYPRIKRVSLPQISLFRRGALEGSSEYRTMEIELANTDGALDRLNETHIVRGQRIEVFVGWHRLAFSSATRRLGGIIESLDPGLDTASLRARDATGKFELNVQDPGQLYFWGLGCSVETSVGAPSLIPVLLPDATIFRGSQVDLEMVWEFSALNAVSITYAEVLYKERSIGVDFLYILRVFNTGKLVLYTNNPAYDELHTPTGLVTIGKTYRIRITLSSTGKAIWIDDKRVAANASNFTSPAGTQGGLAVGSWINGAGYTQGRLSDFRAFSVIRSDAEYKRWMHRPLEVSQVSNLGCYLPLNEGTGTTAFDESGVVTPINGTVTLGTWSKWTTSGTGDKANSGKPMPVALGEVEWARPVQTSYQFLEWRWHFRGSKELWFVTDGARKMNRNYSLTGSLEFLNTGGKKRIRATAGGTLMRFFVEGQVVTVSGTTANNKDFTIQTVTDTYLYVAETMTNETAAGATIKFKTGTDEYSVDLTRSTIRLTLPPGGELRVFAKGDVNSAGTYVSAPADIASRVMTEFLEMPSIQYQSGGVDVTVAPVSASDVTALNALNSSAVGFYSDTLVTARKVMDFVLGSIQGWAVPDDIGVIRLGRVGLPSLGVSTGALNYQTNIIRGGLKRGPAQERAWRYVLTHNPVWHPMTLDQCSAAAKLNFAILVRQVTDPEAASLVDFSDPSIRTTDGNDLQEEDSKPYPTGLVTAASAQTELARRWAMYSAQLIGWSVNTEGVEAYRPGAIVTLTHPRAKLGAPTQVLIISRRPGITPGNVEYEVIGEA